MEVFELQMDLLEAILLLLRGVDFYILFCWKMPGAIEAKSGFFFLFCWSHLIWHSDNSMAVQNRP